MEKEREELEAHRKRVVERIGRGLITDDDAAGALADIRARLNALAVQSKRAHFEVETAGGHVMGDVSV